MKNLLLSVKDWEEIGGEYWRSSPIQYVVVDEFIEKEILDDIHRKLLLHWGWRQKNWSSEHLHNRQPKIWEIIELRNQIIKSCGPVIGDLECLDYWSLMYPENTKGNVHSDYGDISLTIWLTDEKYNDNPETGGLIIYDVKRPRETPIHEDYIPENARSYVDRYTKGRSVKINYKRNRAVFFSADNFHTTDSPQFRKEGVDSMRINLSFAFK